jgi:hypothetical protein
LRRLEMLLLTEDAILNCLHVTGLVGIDPSQGLVRINGRRILVDSDPEKRTIVGCPNYGPTIKPCTTTREVKTGYSDLLRIDGHRICLSTVSGLTDGTPPDTVLYQVRKPGQELVTEGER